MRFINLISCFCVYLGLLITNSDLFADGPLKREFQQYVRPEVEVLPRELDSSAAKKTPTKPATSVSRQAEVLSESTRDIPTSREAAEKTAKKAAETTSTRAEVVTLPEGVAPKLPPRKTQTSTYDLEAAKKKVRDLDVEYAGVLRMDQDQYERDLERGFVRDIEIIKKEVEAAKKELQEAQKKASAAKLTVEQRRVVAKPAQPSKSESEEQVKSIEEQLKGATEQVRLKEQEIAELVARRSALGLFDFKGKRDLDSTLETARRDLENLKIKVNGLEARKIAITPESESERQKWVSESQVREDRRFLEQQVFSPKVVAQIEELSRVKTVESMSDEQKKMAATLVYQVLERVEKMSDATLKSLTPEQRLVLVKLMQSRGLVLNNAQVAAERTEGLIRDLEKTEEGSKRVAGELDASKIRMRASFSVQPGRESLAVIKEDCSRINKLLARLGTETGLNLEAMSQAKAEVNKLVQKKPLSEKEKQKLDAARNRFITNFANLQLQYDLSPEQKKKALQDCRELVKKSSTAAKKFLSEQVRQQKLLAKQIKQIESNIKKATKTKSYQSTLKQIEVINEQMAEVRKILADTNASESEKKLAKSKLKELGETAKNMQQNLTKSIDDLSAKKKKLKDRENELQSQIQALQNVLDDKAYKAAIQDIESSR